MNVVIIVYFQILFHPNRIRQHLSDSDGWLIFSILDIYFQMAGLQKPKGADRRLLIQEVFL